MLLGGAVYEITQRSEPLDTPAARYDRIMDESRGVLGYKREPADELSTVARNLCDNSIEDSAKLVTVLRVTAEGGKSPLGAVISKAAVIKAYCPEQGDSFLAAVRQVYASAVPGVDSVLTSPIPGED